MPHTQMHNLFHALLATATASVPIVWYDCRFYFQPGRNTAKLKTKLFRYLKTETDRDQLMKQVESYSDWGTVSFQVLFSI